MLSPAFAQLLKLGKAVGGQLDFPAVALAKLDALDFDVTGADDLLDQIDQPRDMRVLRLAAWLCRALSCAARSTMRLCSG